jgi:cytochrome P450
MGRSGTVGPARSRGDIDMIVPTPAPLCRKRSRQIVLPCRYWGLCYFIERYPKDAVMPQATATDFPAAPAVSLRTLDDLPGPRGWPLVGNGLQITPRQVHQDMERWARQYGTLYRIALGNTPLLVVADHELIGQITRARPDMFRRPSMTADIAAEMGGIPGLFEAEGAAWRNQRRMVMQAFAPHAVKAYFGSLVKVAGRLQRRWEQAASAQQPIDLGADMRRYTVDIIAGLAFGTDVNTIETGDDVIQGHLDNILAMVARRAFTPVPYWRYIRLPADRRLERSVAAVRAATLEFVNQAKARLAADPARAAHPGNMLEAMLTAAAQPDSGVSEQDVAGNVLTMLLAGEDTTSNSLSWLIYLLARHPEALARARAEVQRVVPDLAACTVEQIDGLDFIDACAQEAMRLKPPAPYMPLEALHDTVVGDVQVPKGTVVWCVLRHHSVDEAHFPRAAQFEPERWMTGEVDKKVAMPFGSGPRMCPGRYLALLEIKIAMAMLLGRFEVLSVQAVAGGEPEEVMGFVMAPGELALRLKTL